MTRASKGIGAGTAKGLAEAGAAVEVNDASSRQDTDRIVVEIEHTGGKAIAVYAVSAYRPDGEQMCGKMAARADALVGSHREF